MLQGTRTFVLQDEDGNIELTHSISAGLDYAAVGPEHAWLRALGRAEYAYVTDDGGARRRFRRWRSSKAFCPALESAHAIAYAQRLARELGPVGDPARESVGTRRQGRADGGEACRAVEDATFARLRVS